MSLTSLTVDIRKIKDATGAANSGKKKKHQQLENELLKSKNFRKTI